MTTLSFSPGVVYNRDRDSAMPNKEQRTTIQSVDRAAGILKALASGPQRLGVSELADRLGLARPTVHGLLQTLLAHGFVQQDAESEKYQLGPGLLQLGYSFLDVNELRRRSIVHAERLALRTGLAVRVGVTHGARIFVVHHVFRPDATLQILEVGAELPLHASALGKAVLSYMPSTMSDEVLDGPLIRLTKRTLTAATLRRELLRIRDSGVAGENDEAVLGESSVAAPIFDSIGGVVGSIGVVGDSDQVFPRGMAKGLPGAVTEAARGISRELGAATWPVLAVV